MERISVNRLLSAAALIATGVLAGACGVRSDGSEARGKELGQRDEFRQTYELPQDVKVTVAGISGFVKIETANTQTAEVHILRSAALREDLEFRKVNVTQSSNGLEIRGERDSGGLLSIFGRRPEIRQEVTLKVPRRISVRTSGVNGPVTVGEITGTVEFSGINGNLKLAEAAGSAKVSGINGQIEAAFSDLNGDGIKMSGINGNIDLILLKTVNADVNISGINGKVHAELPNAEVREQRKGFKARIGSGGIPISMSGINGNVTLNSAVGTASAK